MNIVVDSQMLNYNDIGSGKVIILLHGWGSSLQSFSDVANELAKTYRVISIDFPGFGSSPRPHDDWHVQEYAICLQGFLEKLSLHPHALIGHSFGGRVVLKSVGKKYIHPAKVVLIGSAGVKPVLTNRQLLLKLSAKIGKKVTSLPVLNKLQFRLRRQLYKKVGATDYLKANEMQAIFLNVINEDLKNDAEKITQPGLLIYGEDDHDTPVADAQKLHTAIKNSELIIVPNAGHYVHIDAYKSVIELVKDFLK
jgi:pimeloyl-ACP methyl ester carboxylesterase